MSAAITYTLVVAFATFAIIAMLYLIFGGLDLCCNACNILGTRFDKAFDLVFGRIVPILAGVLAIEIIISILLIVIHILITFI